MCHQTCKIVYARRRLATPTERQALDSRHGTECAEDRPWSNSTLSHSVTVNLPVSIVKTASQCLILRRDRSGTVDDSMGAYGPSHDLRITTRPSPNRLNIVDSTANCPCRTTRLVRKPLCIKIGYDANTSAPTKS